MAKAVIRKQIFLNAPREKVWDFLTDAEKLGQWFYPADGNLKADSDYTLFGSNDDGSSKKMCWGTVLESRAPELLRYSFTALPMNGLMTTVEWQLEEVAEGTKLSLIHEGFVGDTAGFGLLTAFDGGWDKHIAKMRDAI